VKNKKLEYRRYSKVQAVLNGTGISIQPTMFFFLLNSCRKIYLNPLRKKGGERGAVGFLQPFSMAESLDI
jgi:hypothetical protein